VEIATTTRFKSKRQELKPQPKQELKPQPKQGLQLQEPKQGLQLQEQMKKKFQMMV
jgi:hypothetical protein